MQLKINETYKNKEITKLVTIINVYGPTSQRAERDPDELDSFYTKLDETINSVGRSSILILAGHFNAKVGHKQQIDYTCIGNYSKGKRNHNGEKLLEFCEERGLFISNSAFNHPSSCHDRLLILKKTLPTEIVYADDVDFIGLEFADIAEVKKQKYILLVNADKTERTTLSRSGKEYKNTKKVGTLIGDEEDINRRKRLSTAALAKLQNIWI